MQLLKKILLLFIFVSIICCSESNITEPDGSLSDNRLVGVLENWIPENGTLLGMMDYKNSNADNIIRYGECNINEDGSFDLKLNFPPHENLVIAKPLNPPGNITYIPADALIFWGQLGLFHASNPTKVDPVYFGNVGETIQKKNIGDYTINIIYANKNLDVVGDWVEEYESSHIKTIRKYDIHYKTGWNLVVEKYLNQTISGNKEVHEYLFTSEIPSDAKFNYKIYN